MRQEFKSPCSLDWETADNITKTVLDETRTNLREQLDNFYNNESGDAWLHEGDVVLYEKLIRNIDFILTNWYGFDK